VNNKVKNKKNQRKKEGVVDLIVI